MRKNENLLRRRKEFIRKTVNEAHRKGVKMSTIVNRLSESLFLSKQTIYKDLKY